MAEAKLVVSDKGDILSPKYAPEITAPATIGAGKPKAFPIPISAIPTVAVVLHELPIIKETKAVIINVDAKKIAGLSNFKP